jgi:hypothetical protein
MTFQVTTPCKKLQWDIKKKLINLHSSKTTFLNNYKQCVFHVQGFKAICFGNINLSIIVQKIA